MNALTRLLIGSAAGGLMTFGLEAKSMELPMGFKTEKRCSSKMMSCQQARYSVPRGMR